MTDRSPQWALLTAPDLQLLFAQRVRDLRLQAGWKQSSLAERAGVSLTTLQRFERSGLTSTANFLRLVTALGRLHEFSQVLMPLPASSMAALESLHLQTPPRQRGRR